MGWFSKAKKAIRKVAKKTSIGYNITEKLGINKIVHKVTDKVEDAGKKVAMKVGKVINKLGPIGMIAISFIAPYAIGLLASMGGVLGAIGTAIQAVGTAVMAPFKAAGALAGKAIASGAKALGGAISNAGAQSIGNFVVQQGTKIGEMLGGQGIANKTWGEAAGSAFKDVGVKFTQAQVQWDSAFGTNFSGRAGSEVIGEGLAGGTNITGASASQGTGSGVSASTVDASSVVPVGSTTGFDVMNPNLAVTNASTVNLQPAQLSSQVSNGYSVVGADQAITSVGTGETEVFSTAPALDTAQAKKAGKGILNQATKPKASTSTSTSSSSSYDAESKWKLFQGLDPFQNVAVQGVKPSDYLEQWTSFMNRRAQ